MVASLVAALVSAFCYGIAAVMQAIAVRSTSRRTAEAATGEAGLGVDPGLLLRLLRQGPFLASIAIDLVGFIAQLVALRRLPLFAVQAIMASNLAVTAVFAAWLMKARLAVREWFAVGGVVVGVGLLGASAGAQGASTVGSAFQLALIISVVAVGLLGFAAARLPSPARTPVLGAIAGLGYAVLAVSARILPGFAPGQLIKSPATYTLAAAGIVSFMLYATALEGGSVTTATAAVVLAETMPPAVVGVIFLGDTTRHGLTSVAAAGFTVAVICAVLLARFGEAHEDQAPAAGQPPEEAERPRASRRAALGPRRRAGEGPAATTGGAANLTITGTEGL
jgi:drug/metabolite transporter (DMT)-like permease